MRIPLSLTVIGLWLVSFVSGTCADELADLQAQRIETLQRATQLVRAQYQEGSATIQQVLGASAALLDAKLDQAKTRVRRIVVLTELLKGTAAMEKVAQQMVAAGQRAASDYLLAKAARLRVEILLLKEQQRAAN